MTSESEKKRLTRRSMLGAGAAAVAGVAGATASVEFYKGGGEAKAQETPEEKAKLKKQLRAAVEAKRKGRKLSEEDIRTLNIVRERKQSIVMDSDSNGDPVYDFDINDPVH